MPLKDNQEINSNEWRKSVENQDRPATNTFATYLAKQYIAKKGFTTQAVPEASALVEGCDIVLTLADGMSFQMICIIDREAHPGKQFALSRDAVDAIGKNCLKYSGSINGTKMPVTIQIVEVGNKPISTFDSDRLKDCKRKTMFSKVMMYAWIIDSSSGTFWTNTPFNGGLIGRSFIERVLKEPRVSDAQMQPAEAAVQEQSFAWLTYALLAILAAVFAVEQLYGIDPTSGLFAPSLRTLVALGGLTYEHVVQGGEWYRILSATLLHGDLVHLILNGFALYMAGVVLESLVGRAWFFALFVLGGISGSFMSLAVNPPNVVSVGASGAIMGLLTAAFVCSFRFPNGASRNQIQISLLQILIPSMIPLAMSRSGSHVDFGAHLGGALSGLLVGLVMMKTWPVTQPLPRFVRFAMAISVAGVAAFALAAAPIKDQYGSYVLDSLLIPSDQMPKSNEEGRSRSVDLTARYPRDPRAHLMRASALLEASDADGAVRELHIGLGEKEILATKLSPELEARMQTMLALVLMEKGRGVEAKAIATQVCAKSGVGKMRDVLVQNQLCE